MYGDSVAIITDDDRMFTYSQLILQSERFARTIGRRSLVVIMASNNIESITAYVGCLNNKIVPIVLGCAVSKEQLNNIINRYKPSHIWLPIEYSFYFPECEKIYYYGGYVLLSFYHDDIIMNEQLALLLTTSGSTGSCKFVRLSYDNIASNTESIIKSLGIEECDRAVTVLPMSYTYGLSVINTHLYMGATLLLTDLPVYTDRFWNFVGKYNATSFSGVPYTYEMIIKLGMLKFFPKSLRTITQAGGSLSHDYKMSLYNFSQKNHIYFYVMYGQTEATARITCMRLGSDVKHFDSMGRFIEGVDGEIVDDGELVIYGRNVSMGYANCIHDLRRADDNRGRLCIGDIVVMDGDYLYWKGRKDRYVKINGNRISLDEVDMHLKKHYPDNVFISEVRDDRMVIYTDSKNKEDIIHYASDITGLNRKIFNVNNVVDFQRKENGKIDYSLYK